MWLHLWLNRRWLGGLDFKTHSTCAWITNINDFSSITRWTVNCLLRIPKCYLRCHILHCCLWDCVLRNTKILSRHWWYWAIPRVLRYYWCSRLWIKVEIGLLRCLRLLRHIELWCLRSLWLGKRRLLRHIELWCLRSLWLRSVEIETRLLWLRKRRLLRHIELWCLRSVEVKVGLCWCLWLCNAEIIWRDYHLWWGSTWWWLTVD